MTKADVTFLLRTAVLLFAFVTLNFTGVANLPAQENSPPSPDEVKETKEWLESWEQRNLEQSQILRKTRREQESDRRNLTSLPISDLKELQEVADELHEKWSRRDPIFHVRIMLIVVKEMNSIQRLQGVDTLRLREHYVGLVLDNTEGVPLLHRSKAGNTILQIDAETAPVELVVQLVELLSINSVKEVRESIAPEQWNERRKEHIRHWFHAYRLINASVDPDWMDCLPEPKHPIHPCWTYPPPPGFKGGWIGGGAINPGAIDDLEVRKAYIEALEEHHLRCHASAKQRYAETQQKYFLPKAEKYIAYIYSQPPNNDDQLNELLEEFVEDETARRRIRQMVSDHK